MIRKTLCAFAMITGLVANADITLDARLLVSKNAYNNDVQRTLSISEDNAEVDAENNVLQAMIEGYTEDGVVVSFKVFEYDNDGNAVIVSEPTLKCVWNEEAVFAVENDDAESIRLTVIASRS